MFSLSLLDNINTCLTHFQSAIQFALNLHQHHEVPLAQAYTQAVAQFRALRSEHYTATTFAAIEAEYLGAVFSRGEIAHAFEKEKKGLATFERQEELDEGAMAARKRWKVIAEKHGGSKEWTRGEEYVKLWKEGVRPTYAPALTQTLNLKTLTPEQMIQSPDFLHILQR